MQKINKNYKYKIFLIVIGMFLYNVQSSFAAVNDNAKIRFLHHSTGSNVYSQGGVSNWFSNYNTNNETNYSISEVNYPTNGYPWNNYPYDWWNLWVTENTDELPRTPACQEGNVNMECLSNLTQQYDVIIFKQCYPGAGIGVDTGNPDVTSNLKTLENYKEQYRALRKEFDKYPDNLFIAWTLVPLHRLNTDTDTAARAKEFVDWVNNEWLSEDSESHSNIKIFDFWSYAAELDQNPDNGQINTLKYEYEGTHTSSDSHPNTLANQTIGPIFSQAIVDGIDGFNIPINNIININLVEGALIAGENIIIAGENFGEINGGIVSWDDFDSHNIDEHIGDTDPLIGPTWSTQYGYTGDGARYDNSHVHSGYLAAHLDWSIDRRGIRAFGWAGQGPFEELFISYWRYMEGDYSSDINECYTNDGYNCNHKQFYLFGTVNDLPQAMPLVPAGTNVWGLYNNIGDGSVSSFDRNNINTEGLNYGNTIDTFQRWDFFLKLNSDIDCEAQVTCDGIVRYWIDGVLGRENTKYRHRIVDGLYDDFRLGHMASGFEDTAKAWFDDLYISTTQARVEIGNATTWDECTHREIQIVTAWTTNAINVDFNKGSFENDNTVYLYVIDEDGNVNENGYEIVIENSVGVIRADVNQDSEINTTDAMLTLRNSLGLSMTGTAWQDSVTTGDVNCDENSNSTDAMLLLRYSLGLDMSETSWCN